MDFDFEKLNGHDATFYQDYVHTKVLKIPQPDPQGVPPLRTPTIKTQSVREIMLDMHMDDSTDKLIERTSLLCRAKRQGDVSDEANLTEWWRTLLSDVQMATKLLTTAARADMIQADILTTVLELANNKIDGALMVDFLQNMANCEAGSLALAASPVVVDFLESHVALCNDDLQRDAYRIYTKMAIFRVRVPCLSNDRWGNTSPGEVHPEELSTGDEVTHWIDPKNMKDLKNLLIVNTLAHVRREWANNHVMRSMIQELLAVNVDNQMKRAVTVELINLVRVRCKETAFHRSCFGRLVMEALTPQMATLSDLRTTLVYDIVRVFPKVLPAAIAGLSPTRLSPGDLALIHGALRHRTGAELIGAERMALIRRAITGRVSTNHHIAGIQRLI